MREHFFGADPRLAALVADKTDDELKALRRGGHDYRKLYAAYQAATQQNGAPTAILAKTVKGWTLGSSVEARNITHQAKKMNEQELAVFRDRLELPIADEKLGEAPYYHPGPEAPEMRYLMERRAALGGPVPRRVVLQKTLATPGDAVFGEFQSGSGGQEVSTTMAFAKLLRNLLRDPVMGPRVVPIIPDEARTFGMDSLFKEVGIYSALGQLYDPVDSKLVFSYREDKAGQILEEGLTEAGSTASVQAAGTAYATHGEPMIPFYIFYSMFGFQRTGDELWALGDARGRGFLMGATAGRTTLNGEGLQHEDGHSVVHASHYPSCRVYDPAFAYETAAIVRDGLARLYGETPEDDFYYITLYNENHVMPARPEGVSDDDIVRGIYRFAVAPDLGTKAPRATILASGVIVQQALAAQKLLAETYGVAAAVYSAPSFQQLRNDALEVEHWNLHNPGLERRVPHVTRVLAEPAAAGPVIAVSDWITAWPDMISRWVPTSAWRSMGTDGYGRSDTREALRRFFDIDAPHIAAAVLVELAAGGAMPRQRVVDAVAEMDLEPAAPFALGR
jgi:pyruvate dehydrogenase E1 component